MLQTTRNLGLGMSPMLAEGKRRSETVGRPVLVSLTQRLPLPQDPLSIFSKAARIADVRSFWSRPADGFWLVGAGEAAQIRGDGPDRFRASMAEQGELVGRAVMESCDSSSPHVEFIGGFRFDISRAGAEAWREFPDGLFTLPEWTVRQTDGICTATANAMVCADTDIHSLCAVLQERAAGLFGPAEQLAIPGPACSKEHAGPGTWHSGVTGAIEAIRSGRLAKVVLARNLKVRAPAGLSPDTAIGRLTIDYPECRIFAFNRRGSCFIGATPEELVSKTGNRITSVCMAGSARRGLDEREDLLLSEGLIAGEKERREHALVAEWVSNGMGLLCPSVTRDRVPGVVKLGNVQHLATGFVGEAEEGRHVLEFVEALHPTPAAAGVPVDRALELIRNTEHFDRGWYAGPVGWMEGSDGEFAIALRCALLQGNEALLYAGAGIVAGSDAEKEYQETAMKFMPLLAALGVDR